MNPPLFQHTYIQNVSDSPLSNSSSVSSSEALPPTPPNPSVQKIALMEGKSISSKRPERGDAHQNGKNGEKRKGRLKFPEVRCVHRGEVKGSLDEPDDETSKIRISI